MNRICLFLSILLLSSVLSAQETVNLGKEDLLDAFKQHNPAALKKASSNPAYEDLLNKLAMAYSVPRTEKNEIEMIAMVKNFDNSIILQNIKMKYEEGRTLQTVSGTKLGTLEEDAYDRLLPLVKDVFNNTIDVKKMQINRYKKSLKAAKKDKSLSEEEKELLIQENQSKIQSLKQEIKLLKTDRKQKMKDTARVYLMDIKSAYDKKQASFASKESQPELPAKNISAKANPQKTAAQ